MTFIEQGVQGAFRQTWRKGNPRSLLQTIIEKNPGASEEKIYQLFWQEIEDDKELLLACVSYWLDLNYRAILRGEDKKDVPQKTGRSSADSRTKTSSTDVAEKLQRRIKHETELLLLDLIAPNGKQLGDCTGSQCKTFGGLYIQIAKHVPPNKTVRSVLSEQNVQKLWQQASKKQ